MWLILAIGRLKRGFAAEGVAEYVKRARRFARLDVAELPPAKTADPARAVADESAALSARLKPDDHVVLLDVAGRMRSSEELARRLQTLDANSRGRLVFVIGGAYGVSDALAARAQERLSLGLITLPHELARLVLAEQLYRALTIRHNLPYHHG
jgi:23S rRNA (pseudouridine1915-N3)-methyltransferase